MRQFFSPKMDEDILQHFEKDVEEDANSIKEIEQKAIMKN